MAVDLQVNEIDVLKKYVSQLDAFRAGTLSCGAYIARLIRNIEHELNNKKTDMQTKLHTAARTKDELVNRYKPVRQDTSLQGVEFVGTSDYDIQAKYQALEAAINDYNNAIDQINAKMAEIGQCTKTFCMILDSETLGCHKKMEEKIAIMDSMINSKV